MSSHLSLVDDLEKSITTSLTRGTVFPSFRDYFQLDTRSDGSAVLATMTAMYYVGGAVAAFGIGPVAERYGRKWAIAAVCLSGATLVSKKLTLLQSAIMTLISGALLAGSVNVSMFVSQPFDVYEKRCETFSQDRLLIITDRLQVL